LLEEVHAPGGGHAPGPLGSPFSASHAIGLATNGFCGSPLVVSWLRGWLLISGRCAALFVCCSGVWLHRQSQVPATASETRFGQPAIGQCPRSAVALRLRWLQRTGGPSWEAGLAQQPREALQQLLPLPEHQPKQGSPPATGPPACCCGAKGESSRGYGGRLSLSHKHRSRAKLRAAASSFQAAKAD